MSEWGLIAFHYDYEAPDRMGELHRHRGLVSKAYKYPGVPGMILHAFGGLSYFLRLREVRSGGPDMSFEGNRIGLHANLNTAFDVFLDCACIQAGIDTVAPALRGEDIDDSELGDDLFNCEGSYGWIFAEYTGNPADGYKLRSGYFYGGRDEEYKVYDMRGALDVDMRIRDADPDEDMPEELKNAMMFFDENPESFDSEEDFWGVEERGIRLIKELRKEWSNE